MKKLIALLSSIALALGFATPATSSVKYDVYQKTLSSYAGKTTSLTSSQKAQVKAAVEANPNAEKFICTGIRFASAPMSENITVRARAKAACAYAKELNPELSTWFQNKPTNARSYAGKVLLTVKTATGPLPAISLSDYNPAVVTATAYERIDEYLASISTNDPIEFEIKPGPSIPKEQVELESKRIRKSAQFWAAFYDHNPFVFVYSGEDADWMVDQLHAMGNTFHDDLVKGDFWKKTGKCMVSLAGADPVQPYYINCHRDDIATKRMASVASHEFAHLPIMDSFKDRPVSERSQVPIWLNEGGAEFFGVALSDEAQELGTSFWHKLHLNQNDTIRLSTREAKNLKTLLATITASEADELFSTLEKNSSIPYGTSYSVGRWATEILLAHGGMEKYLEFLSEIGTAGWKPAFEKTYEIALGDFYQSLAPYLQWLAKTY